MQNTPSSPSTQPRQLGGWVFCAAIFLLLISLAIRSTAKAADPNSKSSYVQAENLEVYVRAKAMASSVKDSKRAAALLARIRVQPESIAKALEKGATNSASEALLYAEILTELGQPVPAEVVEKLKSDKDPNARLFGQIYQTPSPSPAELHHLASIVPHKQFLTKLARIQALEKAGDTSIRRKTFGINEDENNTPSLLLGLVFIIPMMLCVGILFFYNDSRNRGLLKPIGLPNEAKSDFDADRLAVRAAQLLGLFVAASLLSELPLQFLPTQYAEAIDRVLPDIVMIAGTILLAGIPVMGRKITLADYGLKKDGAKSGFLWGVAGFLGGIPVVVAVGLIFLTLTIKYFPTVEHPIDQYLKDPSNTPLVAAALFVAAIGAPFFEEILFRGTLLPAIAGLFRNEKWQLPVSIGISSILFAACHSTGVPSWGILAGIGALNSLLCYQTKSILPGVIIHVAWNSMLLAITLFTNAS